MAYQPDVHFEITMRDRFIRRIEVQVPWTCSRKWQARRGYSFDYEGLRIPVDREGRFKWRRYQTYPWINGAEENLETRFLGRVGPRSLWGYFSYDLSDGRDLGQHCWTGKSHANPFVKFVARRQRR